MHFKNGEKIKYKFKIHIEKPVLLTDVHLRVAKQIFCDMLKVAFFLI